jgi:hypothetical protein
MLTDRINWKTLFRRETCPNRKQPYLRVTSSARIANRSPKTAPDLLILFMEKLPIFRAGMACRSGINRSGFIVPEIKADG